MSNSINYRIAFIKTANAPFLAEKAADFYIEPENVEFSVSMKLHWEHETEIISNFCSTEVHVKNTKEKLFFTELIVGYQILDYKTHIQFTEKEISTPDTLLLVMFNGTLEIMRGYIYAKTETSFLKNILLPSLSPASFLNLVKEDEKKLSKD
jgi:hypothetical protein